MMGTEMVPETSDSSCNQLTRLIAREDFIEKQQPQDVITGPPKYESDTSFVNYDAHGRNRFDTFVTVEGDLWRSDSLRVDRDFSQ
jgi:hypothetical protein